MDIQGRLARLEHERWTLGVIGLGYVGLPLAMTGVSRDLDVIGFDLDAERIAQLRAGTSHVDDVPDEAVAASLAAGTTFTDDPGALRRADVVVVAVPSPLGRNREPDMSFIEAAAATVRDVATPGMLVALESTTYPGTTSDIIVPAVEAAGLTLDEDVFVAFSPERVDPGNPMGTGEIPKVVGGVTPTSGRVAAAAYARLVDNVHVVSTAAAAELTKLAENTYRAVNIAMVNELAQVAHALDIDIWEVIEAAATKPFGYQPFFPGPGVGGHCIPLDPQFLAWRAREARVTTRFIDLAEDVNTHMPDWVVSRILDLLNSRGLPVAGTRVLAAGMAYKRNVADDRESPSWDVVARLEQRGAVIGLVDPHVPEARLARQGHEVVPADGDLTGWTLAVVLTDHDRVDYAALARQVDAVFDTRGVYRRLGITADNVTAL